MESGDSDIERLARVGKYHRLQVQDLNLLKPKEQAEKLRGMLNKAVYTSAENWMKPQWAILHKFEDEDELEFRNNRYRNHVVIGIPGGRKYSRCDATGLLNVIPDCGSLDFWIYDGDKVIFPAMAYEEGSKLSLISPEDQIYQWSTSTGPVDFSRIIYHVHTNSSESISNEIHVRNRSLEPVDFTFYVVLRPMSFLGVEPIESIVYDENSGRLYANGFLALVIQQKPTAIFMSTADDPNLIGLITSEQKRCDHDFSTVRGLATAILRYDLKLSPAGSQELYFINPLDKLTQNDQVYDMSLVFKLRTKTVQSWFEFSRDTMRLEIPDNVLQAAYTQAKASLAIQAYSDFSKNSKSNVSVLWRERARILTALVKIGCFDLVNKLLSEFSENEDLVETQYEFSLISPLIWILTQYIDYSKDYDFLETKRDFLSQWFDASFQYLQNLFVAKKSDKYETSIEPDMVSEEEQPSMQLDDTINNKQPETSEIDTTIQDNVWSSEELLRLIWNYATIQNLARTLKKEEKSQLLDVMTNCKSLIQEQLEELSIEDKDFLELLSTISLLNLVNFTSEKLDNLLQKMSDTILKDGLVVIYALKKQYSSHHALRIGNYYCLTNQRYMVEHLLDKAMEFLSEYFLLPEFVNPETLGGSAGDGCSIMAAADLIILLRDLLVYESEEDLVLLAGIPEEWYSSSTPVITSDMPTKSGMLNLEIGTSANQYQIELSMTSLPREIEIHVPHSFSMPMIKVFGAGIAERNAGAMSPNIRVVPLSESVVLTAHR